jgi:uncharacterized membrane protein
MAVAVLARLGDAGDRRRHRDADGDSVMIWLILGLVVFLGVHSVRIVAPQWRQRLIGRVGGNAWKGIYSLLSLAGFVLLVWGYAQARADGPSLVWLPPVGLRHAGSLLTLLAFVLLVAAYMPRNHIRRAVGHPMVIGVALWSIAHLLANGWLHGMLLFGAFLLWAVAAWVSAARRGRDRATAPTSWMMTTLTVFVGVGAWFVFARWLHVALIGVAPFG